MTPRHFAGGRRGTIVAATLPLALVLSLAACGGGNRQKTVAAPNPAEVSRVLALDYKKDDAGRPLQEFSVTRGLIVYLAITSDVPGALHLHGYEVEQPVVAGKKTSLVVSADYPGEFSVTFDRGNQEQQIASLDVLAAK
jgi:hypothetical protein